jgi:hypothetical protein
VNGYRLAVVERWRDRDNIAADLVDEIARDARANAAVLAWRRQLVAALQTRNSVAVVDLIRWTFATMVAELVELDLEQARAAGAIALVCADLADTMTAKGDPALWARAEQVADELIAARRILDWLHTRPGFWAFLEDNEHQLTEALRELFAAAGESPPERPPGLPPR